MNIEISTQKLAVDIRRMQSELDNLNATVRRVYECLERLNGMWDGPANDAFRTQTGIDYTFCKQVLLSLNELVELLEYAKGEYQECREAVNSKIASIRLSNDT